MCSRLIHSTKSETRQHRITTTYDRISIWANKVSIAIFAIVRLYVGANISNSSLQSSTPQRPAAQDCDVVTGLVFGAPYTCLLLLTAVPSGGDDRLQWTTYVKTECSMPSKSHIPLTASA